MNVIKFLHCCGPLTPALSSQSASSKTLPFARGVAGVSSTRPRNSTIRGLVDETPATRYRSISTEHHEGRGSKTLGGERSDRPLPTRREGDQTLGREGLDKPSPRAWRERVG